MDFGDTSDEKIFERASNGDAVTRFDALMEMGMRRRYEKVDESIGFFQSAYELAEENSLREHRSMAARQLALALRLDDRIDEAKALLLGEMAREENLEISDFAMAIMTAEYSMILAYEDQLDDAITHLEKAESYLVGDFERSVIAEFFNNLAELMIMRQQFQLGANLAQRARNYALDSDETEELGRAMFFIGSAYERMCMFDEAEVALKEADILLSYRSHGDNELHARLALVRIKWHRKDFKASLTAARELRDQLVGIPYACTELPFLCDLQVARAQIETGQFAEAAETYFKARTLLRSASKNPWAAVAEAEGAVAQLICGNIDLAVSQADNAIRWFNEDPNQDTEFWVKLAYGIVMNALKHYSAALSVLRSVDPSVYDKDFHRFVTFRVELAKAECYAGNPDAGAALAAVVSEFFDAQLENSPRGELHTMLAEAAVRRNHLPEARKQFSLAITAFYESGSYPLIREISLRVGEIVEAESNRRDNEVIEGL